MQDSLCLEVRRCVHASPLPGTPVWSSGWRLPGAPTGVFGGRGRAHHAVAQQTPAPVPRLHPAAHEAPRAVSSLPPGPSSRVTFAVRFSPATTYNGRPAHDPGLPRPLSCLIPPWYSSPPRVSRSQLWTISPDLLLTHGGLQ